MTSSSAFWSPPPAALLLIGTAGLGDSQTSQIGDSQGFSRVQLGHDQKSGFWGSGSSGGSSSSSSFFSSSLSSRVKLDQPSRIIRASPLWTSFSYPPLISVVVGMTISVAVFRILALLARVICTILS